MKIYVATPMYGGQCFGIYTTSLLSLSSLLLSEGHSVIYDYVSNESLITRGRNLIVDRFLKSDYDALLFIDADQGFDAEEVYKLITSGKKFIGAVSPMKQINWESVIVANKYGQKDLDYFSGYFNVNFVDGVTEFSVDEVVEVENVGTGLLFIAREVFESVSPLCESYKKSLYGGVIDNSNDSEKIVEFFATSIDKDGILLSEDFHFCSKWKSLGKKVYIAPWVRLTHAGVHIFNGKFAESAVLNASIKSSLSPIKDGEKEEQKAIVFED
jgi:hypothetical protein